MALAGSTCPHIQNSLDAVRTRYKTVLAWNVHRSQAVRASGKRRKQLLRAGYAHLRYLVHSHVYIAILPGAGMTDMLFNI
ncbi:hypothetical protein CC1G_14472 [Coprinopsis cinerea okayama7|uniref:Uncharacterized protein n=1 Tax=Coprinopsis cinerea (strain Okayama-7 / 130 / ATCC MYA-4618 / FGSC 9003) TaxID=240176 RepID=D6RMC7_COPC7|nr:hypothetical protein CC1G_14472 [Coprinopsis cinerea okayama7\|eukprot:XP_002911474.1 hypothetical protein CC1G_14472 [Coprinopsis cinerea okayama7\